MFRQRADQAEAWAVNGGMMVVQGGAGPGRAQSPLGSYAKELEPYPGAPTCPTSLSITVAGRTALFCASTCCHRTPLQGAIILGPRKSVPCRHCVPAPPPPGPSPSPCGGTHSQVLPRAQEGSLGPCGWCLQVAPPHVDLSPSRLPR